MDSDLKMIKIVGLAAAVFSASFLAASFFFPSETESDKEKGGEVNGRVCSAVTVSTKTRTRVVTISDESSSSKGMFQFFVFEPKRIFIFITASAADDVDVDTHCKVNCFFLWLCRRERKRSRPLASA